MGIAHSLSLFVAVEEVWPEEGLAADITGEAFWSVYLLMTPRFGVRHMTRSMSVETHFRCSLRL